jgi:aspartate aminotransferase-like enzyme
VIASGYGKLKDTTFRIGHMGDHTLEELDELLGVLEEILLK